MSPLATEPLERRAIISGIGQSDVGRRLGRSDIDLTVEACLAAVADAGLTRDDIDGLATYPGMGVGTPGFAGPTSSEVQDAMRLRLNWHDGGGEGPGQMRAVITACLAVAAGLARHVLVYRTVSESTAQGAGGRQGIGGAGGGGGAPRFSGFLQWTLPFGAVSAVNWLALVAERRMYEFGLTREQLGQIAVNCPTQRRTQSQGRLPGSHEPRRLPGRPDDLHPALPVRLRRPERRLHRRGGLPPRLRARRPPSGLPCERSGHRPVGTAQLGPVRRPHHHGRPGRRRPRCGSGPNSARPTSTWPSCTTASPFWPWCGWRRWGSVVAARADPSWRAARPSPGTGSCPSTPQAGSCPADDCTASG